MRRNSTRELTSPVGNCVCVLGMHRSGTSCLAGFMHNFGVELGEVYTENLHNKRGNRENSRIVFLNDALLTHNGGSWSQPVVTEKWTMEMLAERDAIIQELSSGSGAYWGFKDTRTLFTLPFWLGALQEPKFIGTFRHPQSVALSLNKRDQMPSEQSWELWRIYNERLLNVARELKIPLVDFDDPADEYIADTLAKLTAIGLDPTRTETARAFFDPELRNQADNPMDDSALPAPVTALYKELQNYNKNF